MDLNMQNGQDTDSDSFRLDLSSTDSHDTSDCNDVIIHVELSQISEKLQEILSNTKESGCSSSIARIKFFKD